MINRTTTKKSNKKTKKTGQTGHLLVLSDPHTHIFGAFVNKQTLQFQYKLLKCFQNTQLRNV